MVTLNDLVQGLSHGSPEKKGNDWNSKIPNLEEAVIITFAFCVKLGKWKPGAAFSPQISESSTMGWTTLNGNASTVQGCNDPRNSADKMFACYLPNGYHPWINVSVQKSFTHDVCIFDVTLAYLGPRDVWHIYFTVPTFQVLLPWCIRGWQLFGDWRTNSPKWSSKFVDVLRGFLFIPGLYSYSIPTLCKTEHFLIPTKILGKPTLWTLSKKRKPSIPRVFFTNI